MYPNNLRDPFYPIQPSSSLMTDSSVAALFVFVGEGLAFVVKFIFGGSDGLFVELV